MAISRPSPENITLLPPTQTPSCPRHKSCSSDRTELHPTGCCAEIKLLPHEITTSAQRRVPENPRPGRKEVSLSPRSSAGSGRSLNPVRKTTSPEGAVQPFGSLVSERKLCPLRSTHLMYLAMSKHTPTYLNLFNKT